MAEQPKIYSWNHPPRTKNFIEITVTYNGKFYRGLLERVKV